MSIPGRGFGVTFGTMFKRGVTEQAINGDDFLLEVLTTPTSLVVGSHRASATARSTKSTICAASSAGCASRRAPRGR